MIERMSGGEAMVRAAKANGVDTVFGLPGAQIYPLFDALARCEVTTIVPRHEQAAAYMAMGAAKSTGKPAAFAVVPGPGVLNTTAALCTAMGTCAPVLCMTGQVPSTFLGVGRGHLHELADQAGTLRTLIKDALRIDDPTKTSAIMNDAFLVMQSHRPGPVSVEMCWDTMAQEWDVPLGIGNHTVQRPEVDSEAIRQAAAALAAARNPMIMCGGGAQHASAEVLALAERLGCPVTSFRSGRGVVAEDHELGASSFAARLLWDECDLVLGIGSRLEMMYMRWTDMGSYQARANDGRTVIRIDIDPAEMQRFEPDIGVLADSASACVSLLEELDKQGAKQTQQAARIQAAKIAAEEQTRAVSPQAEYLDAIRAVLPRDGFFVPELSQMGFTSYYRFPVYQPRTYVTEGFQGTLGFGFPTALGVKVANPDKAVVSVNGDGGFMFGVQELATAAQYGIGLVSLVFNNSGFGNVRRDQINRYEGRLLGADLDNPDFVALAEAFGVKGVRVNKLGDFQVELERAIAADSPALIEVEVATGSEASPWPFIHTA